MLLLGGFPLVAIENFLYSAELSKGKSICKGPKASAHFLLKRHSRALPDTCQGRCVQGQCEGKESVPEHHFEVKLMPDGKNVGLTDLSCCDQIILH